MKVDARLTNADSLLARYSISDSYEYNALAYPALKGTELKSKAQNATMRWTRVIKSVSGECRSNRLVRFALCFWDGITRPKHQWRSGNSGIQRPVSVPARSMPVINLTGYTQIQGSPFDGRPKAIKVRTWQESDTMTWIHGRHELKFGGELMNIWAGFSVGQNSVGVWSFTGTYSGNSIADLLLGYPDNGTRGPYQTLQGDYDLFKAVHFNDNWRVRPSLTINVGVRWK